ncbi:hypothetical protein BJ508DRAFT_307127 [Ascobolus immersus RN42]|uniref:Uncharacterized protein n=1 Tax=Ascobolus immersus RN42 TaxID=1160509 RepID=A0A3N4I3I7_ASCIM|nr:hypothetical protein BJ508DRAFT_307127 [Ascobolus immersus RN42]
MITFESTSILHSLKTFPTFYSLPNRSRSDEVDVLNLGYHYAFMGQITCMGDVDTLVGDFDLRVRDRLNTSDILIRYSASGPGNNIQHPHWLLEAQVGYIIVILYARQATEIRAPAIKITEEQRNNVKIFPFTIDKLFSTARHLYSYATYSYLNYEKTRKHPNTVPYLGPGRDRVSCVLCCNESDKLPPDDRAAVEEWAISHECPPAEAVIWLTSKNWEKVASRERSPFPEGWVDAEVPEDWVNVESDLITETTADVPASVAILFTNAD